MAASVGDAVHSDDENFDLILRSIKHGKNVIMHGPGGTGKCLHPMTKILTHKGLPIYAKDVRPGDVIMGPEGEPRNVITVNEGEGHLYKIVGEYGNSFIVNDVHILTLFFSQTGSIVDIPLNQFMRLNRRHRAQYYLIKSPVCMKETTPEETLYNAKRGVLSGSISHRLYAAQKLNDDEKYDIHKEPFFSTLCNSVGVWSRWSRKEGFVVHQTRFQSFNVEYAGFDKYCGFTLDSDGRFLLSNFIITHNTFTINKITRHLMEENQFVQPTAFTGIAATHLSQADIGIYGKTLNSWMGIGLATGTILQNFGRVKMDERALKRIIRTRYLIIDEISMVGMRLFNIVDGVLKLVRGNKEPMGGIVTIFSGDFLQLPPVKDDWIFKSMRWESLKCIPVIFEKSKRYKDEKYFQFLLRARNGNPAPEDFLMLAKRIRAYNSLMKMLEDTDLAIKPTILYSTRMDVNLYNLQEMEKIEGDVSTFSSKDHFIPEDEKDNSTSLSEQQLEIYKPMLDDQIPYTIEFKIGAQVMLKVNLDVEYGYVNGSRGVVVRIDPEVIYVRFLDECVIPIEKFSFAIETEKGIVVRKQFPLILAWALTIHKSQGATLDYVVCDLGNTIFLDAQAYVALSRVRDIKGLFIKTLRKKSIRADKDALIYSDTLKERSLEYK